MKAMNLLFFIFATIAPAMVLPENKVVATSAQDAEYLRHESRAHPPQNGGEDNLEPEDEILPRRLV